MKSNIRVRGFLAKVAAYGTSLFVTGVRREIVEILRGFRQSGHKKSGQVILVETISTTPATFLLPLFSFLRVIRSLEPGANALGYCSDLVLTTPLPRRAAYFRDFLHWKLGQGPSRVYRAAGVKRFKLVPHDSARLNRARSLVDDFYSTSPDKSTVADFSVESIKIGDLLYDHFLRAFMVASIEINDQRFRDFFVRFVDTTLFWIEFFEKHDVRAVAVCNHEYGTAIPQRVAIWRTVPTYVLRLDRIVSLNRDHPNARFLEEVSGLKEDFQNLASEQREKLLRQGKDTLEARINGQLDRFIPYMKQSAFAGERTTRQLRESNKFKILIATHCMWDAPNLYGPGIFPDYWEWLMFLGDLSRRVDYDWYIKDHPSFTDADDMAIQEFLGLFPWITRIPRQVSHHQLIDEGLGGVVTIYGSIGHEMPALGVPVINASSFNYHKDWDFNYHPATPEELEENIRNLPRLGVPQEARAEIEEYFAAKHYRFESRGTLFFPSLKRTDLTIDHPEEDELYELFAGEDIAGELARIRRTLRPYLRQNHPLRGRSVRAFTGFFAKQIVPSER